MMRRRPKKGGAPALMLTSLLDMFTIILIFLIVSFEAEDYDFKLDSKLTLPESQAKSVFKPAVNMSITQGAVILEQQKIAVLAAGKVRPEDEVDGGIGPVVDALKTLYDEKFGEDAVAAAPAADDDAEGEDETAPILLVQADKDLDYSTLYLVMRSARMAGFARYRLAVMKK